MSIDAPILVTGAAGRMGGVGGEVVRSSASATCRSARWSGPRTNGPPPSGDRGRGRRRRPHPPR